MSTPEEFPLVTGDYRMTKEWSISLPEEYRRRFEDNSLVIWRPGMTLWIDVWGMEEGETPKGTLEWIKGEAHPSPVQTFEPDGEGPLRFAYLLQENENGEERWALYSFSVGSSGHVQMAIYFDAEEHLGKAEQLWLSLEETP